METSASAESIWEYFTLFRNIILKSGLFSVSHAVQNISSGFIIVLILINIVSGTSRFSLLCIWLTNYVFNSSE